MVKSMARKCMALAKSELQPGSAALEPQTMIECVRAIFLGFAKNDWFHCKGLLDLYNLQLHVCAFEGQKLNID